MVLIIRDSNITIETPVDVGLYQFVPDSGTGKTRLLQLLMFLKSRDLPYDGITYSDIRKGRDLNNIRNDTRILVVDRYDMYPAVADGVISRLLGRALIIMDSKFVVTGLDVAVDGELEVRLLSADHIVLEV